MATSIYYQYGGPRTTAFLNTKFQDVIPAGKYRGFQIQVLDGAARTLKALTSSDRSALITPEGVKITEDATVNISGTIGAGGASDRYDIIYCEYTHGANAQPSYNIRAGTVGGGIPSLNDTNHQVRLAYILVSAGATTISNSDITNDDELALSVQDLNFSDLNNITSNVSDALLSDTTATASNPFLTQDAIIGGIERENIADFRPYASTTADEYLNIAIGSVLNSSGKAIIQKTSITQEDLSGYSSFVSITLDDTGTFNIAAHLTAAAATDITDLAVGEYPIAIVDMRSDAVVTSGDITDIRGAFTRGANSVYGLGELTTNQGAALANVPSTATAANPLIPSSSTMPTIIGCGACAYKVGTVDNIYIQPGYVWDKDNHQWKTISGALCGPYDLADDTYWQGTSQLAASGCWLYVYWDFDNNRPILLGSGSWTPTDPDMDMYSTYSGQSVRFLGMVRIRASSVLYETWTGDGKKYFYTTYEGDAAANLDLENQSTVASWLSYGGAGNNDGGVQIGMTGYSIGGATTKIIPGLAHTAYLLIHQDASLKHDHWTCDEVPAQNSTFWITWKVWGTSGVWVDSHYHYIRGWEVDPNANISPTAPNTLLGK